MRNRTGSQCSDIRSGTEQEKRGDLCETILDTLKFSNVFTGDIMKEGITVMKSTTNKSCCDRFSNCKRHISANAATIANIMIKTATTCFRDIMSKVKVMIKGHAYFSYRGS